METEWITFLDEALMAGILGLASVLIGMLRGIVKNNEKAAADAEAARQTTWDNAQKLQELSIEISRLREEHKEIQQAQERADELIGKFADAVSQDVRTIMRDHSAHEVGQARMESKLDELVRRTYES